MDRLIATRSYADDPIAGSTLSAKCNFNADGLKEGLHATQSASKRTRIPGPIRATTLVRTLKAYSQEIGGAACPREALVH
jgi:hypothetical protein